jgi:2'-5' RNA ligase
MKSDQPFLPGFLPPAPPAPEKTASRHTQRLYYAVRPDRSASDAATVVLDDLHLGISGSVKPENRHVSLILIHDGVDVPPGFEARACACARDVNAAPFVLTFDKVESFKSRERWCVVLTASRGIAGLYELQRKLIRQFSGNDRMGSFMPHMTLMYARNFVEKQPIAPISWTVRELLLLRSYPGSGRQDIVMRQSLR